MIPFFVVDRPISLEIVKSYWSTKPEIRYGIMTHALTTERFRNLFARYPCGDHGICRACGQQVGESILLCSKGQEQLSVMLWECLNQSHRGLSTPELQRPLGTPIVMPQGACDPTTHCSGRRTAACCGLEAQSKDGGSLAPAAEHERSASNL
jgi:hypothetical protein